MQAKDLVGTWSLKSYIANGSDGTEAFPFGESPQGLLTYTAEGHMAVVFMSRGRPKFASGDPLGGTLEEIKQAFEGFDAYAGKYECDETSGTVTHHVEVARFPNWVNTLQVRYPRLVDGWLHLGTPPIPALGQEWVLSLVWRRAGER